MDQPKRITVSPGEEVPDPRQQISGEEVPPPVTMGPDINKPLLALTNPETGAMQLPPLTMRAMLLLEKIESPFVAEPEPEVNPVTGEVVMDPETGRPKTVARRPSIQQVAEAFFVLLNEDRPDILPIIRNESWESIILEFASGLGMADLARIGQAINQQMMAINEAAAPLGGGAGSKKPTGPTTSLAQSSPTSEAAPKQSGNG